MKISTLRLWLLTSLLSPAAAQSTWYVDAASPGPGDGSSGMPFSSIQYAIDQGSTLSGDTLSIGPGNYMENLVLMGKSLHLLGEQGATGTVVDANNSAPALRVEGPASAGSSVRGLSLLNGNGSALGFGGGLQALETELQLTHCVLSGAEFVGEAAGFYSRDSLLYLEHVEVRDNGSFFITPVFQAGGGFVDGGQLLALDCRFENNHAAFDVGGLRTRDANVRLTRVTFEANTAGFGHGGGASFEHSDVSLHDCDFRGCLALDAGDGGGIFAFSSDLNIKDSRFDHCEGDDGGAAYLSDCVTVIERCHFGSNLASEYDPVLGLGRGGALALSENFPGTLWIERSVFANNLAAGSSAAASGHGGAVFGPAFLVHVSASGNIAADGGGALAGAVSVDHCALWGNLPDELLSPGNVSWSNVQGGYSGPGNFAADPLFWLSAHADLHLSLGSPCIDAGDPQADPDQDGSIADVGALPFEPSYVPRPASYCEAGVHLGGCAAELRAHGSPTVTGADDFELRAMDLPNRTYVLLLMAAAPADQVLAGDLCLDPASLTTLAPVLTGGTHAPADCSGGMSYALDQNWMASQGISAGSVRYFQLRYRDGSGGFSHSSALRVQFAAP